MAGVAQLAEQLICNQQVGGSNPFASSKAGAAAVRLDPTESFLAGIHPEPEIHESMV